ncbi:MAG TPA: hypothetical protein VIF64_10710 [Pyrinomonadaceae bacterium]
MRYAYTGTAGVSPALSALREQPSRSRPIIGMRYAHPGTAGVSPALSAWREQPLPKKGLHYQNFMLINRVSRYAQCGRDARAPSVRVARSYEGARA